MKNLFLNEGLKIDEKTKRKLDIYLSLLLEWNKKINLTAITNREEIFEKHFLDSALILKFLNVKEGRSVIDIGTGAGFPGFVLKIIRPDIELTVLDSVKKKIDFLKCVDEEIKLGVNFINARAEDAAHILGIREEFDVCVSRAVAELRILLEYCMGFVKVGGFFCALKGPKYKEEVDKAENMFSTMCANIKEINTYKLPGGSERSILLLEKIKKLSNQYPRKQSAIKNKPL